MEPLDLTVPKNKCLLDFLAEQGEKTQDAWIYLHRTLFARLEHTKGITLDRGKQDTYIFTWEATEEYPEEKMVVKPHAARGWWIVVSIETEDENIYFRDILSIEWSERLIRLRAEVV